MDSDPSFGFEVFGVKQPNCTLRQFAGGGDRGDIPISCFNRVYFDCTVGGAVSFDVGHPKSTVGLRRIAMPRPQMAWRSLCSGLRSRCLTPVQLGDSPWQSFETSDCLSSGLDKVATGGLSTCYLSMRSRNAYVPLVDASL